ncbi:MAG TPA: hypothetical protein VHL57_02515 [Flavobacteriales bacterium]|nr:hypothetical protein [Flavobacteriales bacterium]
MRRKNGKIGAYDYHEERDGEVLVILKNGRIKLSDALLNAHRDHPEKTSSDQLTIAANGFEADQ